MSTTEQSKRNPLSDLSLWLLLLSNVVTIYFAVKENWNLSTIMWIYWFQSVTIGIFNFIRILQLKEFSTENFELNGKPAQPTQATKFFTAFFFLFHYGAFHLGYFVFLKVMPFINQANQALSLEQFKLILAAAVIFFINHLFSFVYNKPRDTQKPNIGLIMFYPYARIIPMHLTIIFGAFFGQALLLFLILKTFADLLMHAFEHNLINKKIETEIEFGKPSSS